MIGICIDLFDDGHVYYIALQGFAQSNTCVGTFFYNVDLPAYEFQYQLPVFPKKTYDEISKRIS